MNDLISNILMAVDFVSVPTQSNTKFWQQINGEAKRFVAVLNLSELGGAEEINKAVLAEAPDDLTRDPSFAKNADLIVSYKLKNEKEYVKIAPLIYSIEENPYQFKKYFFHYNQEEEDKYQELDYDKIKSMILNQEEFDVYKKNPQDSSVYSFISRLLIKMPFVPIPFRSETLETIEQRVEKELIVAGLNFFYERALKTPSLEYDADQLISELVNEELENK